MITHKSWTTKDELQSITLMASDKPRKKDARKLTKEERKKKLKGDI